MTPSLGVEIELGAFAPGRPIGRQSLVPQLLLQKIQERHRWLRSANKGSGVFTCGGQAYLEMDRFLEVSTFPGSSPTEAMAAEDAAIELVARAAVAAGLPQQGYSITCLADDLTRNRDPQTILQQDGHGIGHGHGHSMGFHVNLVLPALTAQHQRAFVTLAALLPEVTGPGGFVRDPDGHLRFWRDPRAAHVRSVTCPAAHYAGKPILKLAEQPLAPHTARLQLTSMGWTPGRMDRRLRYGLLMLLAAAANERGEPRQELALCDPIAALRAAPGETVEFTLRGARHRTDRLHLLEVFVEELLAPVAETVPFGPATLTSTRMVLAELRACRDADQIALRVPLHWAIRQNVFQRLCAEHGARLPVHGQPTGHAPQPELLERLALLAVMDQDILSERTREWLLAAVPGGRWSHAEVFGRDAEAVRAVGEDRAPGCAGRVGERFEGCVAAAAAADGKRRGVDWMTLNG